MPAAIGPPCEVCQKKQSRLCVPRCPFCRRVVCWRCLCPGWSQEKNHPYTREREIDVVAPKAAARRAGQP